MVQRVMVTGGNAGIGLALCKQLVSENGCHVYLGARNLDKGKAAVESILKDCPAASGRLDLVQVDTSSDESVAAAAETMKGLLGSEKLYGLVNNAGTGLGHGVSGDAVLSTNLYGPKRMIEAFMPLLDASEGRIVNVGSGAGPMYMQRADDATKKLLKSPDVTWEQIEGVVKQEKAQPGFLEDGFQVYALSKACVHAYTMVVARTFPNIKTSVCSPGFIVTNMTKNMGASKPPEEGTISIKHCLFGNLGGNGWYFGSDALRSPLDVMRNPGEPEYQGD
mmetsp:Transcript_83083/g.240454  ORF Transcript_83083/g.240454 Transcript_83083/m.240454 type:complete len:278 (+) Transcript_83083:75-908(+)